MSDNTKARMFIGAIIILVACAVVNVSRTPKEKEPVCPNGDDPNAQFVCTHVEEICRTLKDFRNEDSCTTSLRYIWRCPK